ncbi:unannotated protein [freshwater metagenome]|uniref:Unannotated protein n=1 Tax=freshwater metagenome TaxID=449393 RepID=A0A6J5YHI9_9ZZZZ
MSGLQSASIVHRATLAQCFEMSDSRIGSSDDPGAGDVSSPTKVEVLAMECDLGVETSQRFEEVGPNQSDRALHVEHVTHRIELLLVEITALHIRGRLSVPIGTHAHRKQSGWVGPFNDLGADDAGVRSIGLLDKYADDTRFESDIVVTQQEERCALNRDEGLVGGGGEPRIGIEPPQMRCGQNSGNSIPESRRIGTGCIDEEHRDVRIILGIDAGEGLLEPPSGVMGDHHDHDGRSYLFIDGLISTSVGDAGGLGANGFGGRFFSSHDGHRG